MNFGYKNFIFAVISAVKMDFNLLKICNGNHCYLYTKNIYMIIYI